MDLFIFALPATLWKLLCSTQLLYTYNSRHCELLTVYVQFYKPEKATCAANL